ncbi:MAG: transporter [Symbiobacteriaceae bacterium]|jgi:PPP family 3-phenylpropionic acid transporter|nr:transporter [Symbiobacteriaceae bacterium]
MSVVFFYMFGAIGALSPYLSLFYKEAGLSATQISVLMSITPFLLFFSQPIFGPLTDRSGHRGRMLALLLLVVAGTGGFIAAGTTFWTLLPLVALWSFFSGVLVPIGDSIALGEVVSRGVTYPQIRLWGSVGFLIVTTIMGRAYDIISLRWAFPIYALLMAVGWYYARRLPADGISSQRSVWPALKGLLRNRRLTAFLLLSAIIAMANAAHAAFFSVHLQSIGGTNTQVGYAWALAALVEVPLWLVLGRITKKIGPLPLLAFAGFAFAVRFWLYGATTVPLTLVFMQALQGLSFAVFMPTAVVFVGEMTGDELRTSGQALLVLVNSGVATIFGTLGAGRLVDAYGTAVLYRVAGNVAFVAGVGFVALMALLSLRQRVRAVKEG